MSTENEQKQQDIKLLSLIPNFLNSFTATGHEVLPELRDFLTKTYLELSAHEFFNESGYRDEWLTKIVQLENLAAPFKGYTDEEIQMGFDIAILMTKKRREEVSNA